MGEPQREDRRVEKTRQAVQSAFVGLIFERRYEDVKIADIIERANVGRSTFYEHYSGKEDVLERSMAHLLGILADAGCGAGDMSRLAFAVSHFWENRRLARTVFGPPLDVLVRRWLGAMIHNRLAGAADPVAAQMSSVQIASAQLTLLEAWLTGKIVASQAEIMDALAGAAPSWLALGSSGSASARAAE